MTKKLYGIILIFIAGVVLSLIALYLPKAKDTWVCENGVWVKYGNPSTPQPDALCEATTANQNMNAQPTTPTDIAKNQTPPTTVEEQKYAISDDMIIVESPQKNAVVVSPLEVRGKARGSWFFEASFPIKLLNSGRKIIAQGIAQAEGEWMTQDFVPFHATLIFTTYKGDMGTLILEKDNPSGLREFDDKREIPLKFGGPKRQTVLVFFNNDQLDPDYSCNKVFPVERTIPRTQAVGRAALEELLKGPTDKEKKERYFTSINGGVIIQKLTIENGIARVDFSDELEFQVGGSCRVAAIRAQIIETLKQFPSVSEVIISINKRTEDILQP